MTYETPKARLLFAFPDFGIASARAGCLSHKDGAKTTGFVRKSRGNSAKSLGLSYVSLLKVGLGSRLLTFINIPCLLIRVKKHHLYLTLDKPSKPNMGKKCKDTCKNTDADQVTTEQMNVLPIEFILLIPHVCHCNHSMRIDFPRQATSDSCSSFNAPMLAQRTILLDINTNSNKHRWIWLNSWSLTTLK